MTNSNNIEQIQAYFEGHLSPQKMRELEEQALDDSFLSDAMEGYAQKIKNPSTQVSLLQQQLYAQVQKRSSEKGMFGTTAHRLSIALVAAVLLICLLVLFWMKRVQWENHKNPEHIQKNIEVEFPEKR